MKALALFFFLVINMPLLAVELQPQSANNSLRNEVQIAIDKGLAFLQKNQNEDGSWGLPEYPAQTALPLTVFMLEAWKESKEKPTAVEKGYAALLKSVQADGGIYVKGLANYNTSISLVALQVAGNPHFDAVISAARNFVIGQQARNMVDSSLDGGIGYGPIGTHSGTPDLSNTVMAIEALRVTKPGTTGEIPSNAKDLNWPAVVEFIQRCQNLPETNKAAWVSNDPEDRGGFVYAPGESKAGGKDAPEGKKSLRSYGSMSYAGLLSYIYADLKKDDPRVIAVIEWLRTHYTLEENPGMGQEGLFYYYCMMAKALHACHIQQLELKDGRKVDWRKDLALKLFNQQKPDGSWSNDNGRWMEKDPALVTCYALIALEIIHQDL